MQDERLWNIQEETFSGVGIDIQTRKQLLKLN